MSSETSEVGHVGQNVPSTAMSTPRVSAAAVPTTVPKSATNFLINSVGLVSMIASIVVLRALHASGKVHVESQNRVLIMLGATAIPIGFLDLLILKVHRRESTGLDWDKAFTPNAMRIVTKLLGLLTTVSAIAGAYWLFPEYHGAFYNAYYNMLRRFWPTLVLLAIVYFTLIDGQMKEPQDTYWQIGRWLLGRNEDVKGKDVANHARGWLVKLFFLPLMMVYAHDSTTRIVEWRVDALNMNLYRFLFDAIYLGDLAFCVVGYVMSFRITDSHQRTAEPTMVGWCVALFCYQPFFAMFDKNYVQYDGIGFDRMLEHYPSVRTAWAVVILVLTAIYVLATVAFGWRFSNLTHRGILTNGPYRYTKHPAYVSKNLSWWLVSVPFMAASGGFWDGVAHSILLAFINTMYFLRARTEERHLSRDPTYVAYALWMNEHGAFAWLGKRVPFFRYVAPTNLPPITSKQEAQAREAALVAAAS